VAPLPGAVRVALLQLGPDDVALVESAGPENYVTAIAFIDAKRYNHRNLTPRRRKY
jgi:hypothetical protein